MTSDLEKAVEALPDLRVLDEKDIVRKEDVIAIIRQHEAKQLTGDRVETRCGFAEISGIDDAELKAGCYDFAEFVIKRRDGRELRGYLGEVSETVRTPTKEPEIGWRPIDTAPKDGSRLICVVSGYQATVAYWNGKAWWNDRLDASKLAAEYSFGDSNPSYEPTRWMPLPPAPTKENVE